MAGEFSTFGASTALDAVSGRTAAAARTTYLALVTLAPTDATTAADMAELFTPGSNGYNRAAVTWAAPTGDPVTTSNTDQLTFGAFEGDPGNVVGCVLLDAATGTTANVLAVWTLDAARDAAAGDTITFAAGALTLSCD